MKIIVGDCVEELSKLEAGSIPLCVTSPPYGGLRTYNGKFTYDFNGLAYEMYRILCDGGILCWVIGDEVKNGAEMLIPFRQAVFFVDRGGLQVHDTMIYHKLNFSHPEKVRYHQVFEFVLILSKGKPRTFNPIVDKPNARAGQIGNLGVNSFTLRDGSKSLRRKKIITDNGMRGNVWTGKTRGQEEMCKKLPRTAMMPKWLARDLILSWSNPGDTVLDPFAGSGTVGQQAEKHGRHAILIDIDPELAELGTTKAPLCS